MKHKYIKLSIIFLLIALSFTNISAVTYANQSSFVAENGVAYEPIDLSKLENKDFVQDTVLVVLKKEYSVINKTYLPSDFKGIQVESVKDLTYIDGDIESNDIINRENFQQILSLTLKDKGRDSIAKAIELLQKREDIFAAEPEYIQEITYTATTNDPFFYSNQTGMQIVKATDAWGITRGSKNVKVGVKDTGIDIYHEDLAANTMSGKNVDTGSTLTTDSGGHGTCVAGTIGAVGNNGKGVSGVAQQVTMVPIVGSLTNTLNYAINNNIQIVNISQKFPNYSFSDVAALDNYNGIVICSAGNDGVDNDTTPQYPASYPNDNIISVSGSKLNDERDTGLNYGKTTVDLYAPNQNYSTIIGSEKYDLVGATSIAAPYVTGTAALIKSLRPDLEPLEIKDCIMRGVDKNSYLSNYCVTGGRLNVYNSLTIAYSYQKSDIFQIQNYKSGLYLDSSEPTFPYQQNNSYNPNQLWEIKYLPDGYCELLLVGKPGRCLTLAASSPSDAGYVSFANRNESDQQKWKITHVSGTTANPIYKISPKLGSGYALEIINSSLDTGIRAQIWTYNPTVDGMKWKLTLNKPIDGIKYVQNSQKGFYLESNNTYVTQYAYNGDYQQQWEFKYVNGYYEIIPIEQRLYRLTLDGTAGNGVTVSCGSSASSDTQKWIVNRLSDGRMRISPKSGPDYAMEISGSANYEERTAQIWAYGTNGGNYMKWNVSSTDIVGNNYTYYMKSYRTSFYMDSRGTDPAQYAYSGSIYQKWQLKYTPEGYEIIPSNDTTKRLAYTVPTDGNKIVLQNYTGGQYQKWLLIPSVNGMYLICSKFNPQCVLAPASMSSGSLIQLQTRQPGAIQAWLFS